MEDDDTIIEHEIAHSDDGHIWQLTIKADESIEREEFGAILISLGKDILSGDISFDGSEDKTVN